MVVRRMAVRRTRAVIAVVIPEAVVTSATRIDRPPLLLPSSWEEGLGVEEINSFTYLSILIANIATSSAITALVLASTILRTAILILAP